MSLYRTYRVRCDGRTLASRTNRLFPVQGDLDHEGFGPGADTSQKARRRAVKNGWTRITKTLPITSDPTGPTSDLTFDLCPSCTTTAGSE